MATAGDVFTLHGETTTRASWQLRPAWRAEEFFRMPLPAPVQRPLVAALAAIARLRGYPALA